MRRVRRRRLSPFAAGLLTLAVVAVACFFAFTKANPFAQPYEFAAAVGNAKDIKPRSPVRVGGVTVGRVTGVEPVGGDPARPGAIVRMRIDDEDALPLHTDARLKIRPRLFLEGNWFVELKPGSPSAPELPEGGVLPIQQTSYPVQVSDVLEVFDREGRDDLRRILVEYGRALARGGGAGVNRAVGYAPRAFRHAAQVNEATRGRFEHDLTRYLRGVDRVARGLDRDPAALKALVRDLGTTAAAFASEAPRLRAAIAELPRTLRAGRSAFGELNRAFPPVRRLVADMRPAVRAADPALTAQLPLVRELRGLVQPSELRGLARDLRRVVPDLVELNRGGIPLQEQLRLLSSCNNEVIVPWRRDEVPDRQFPASGPVYQEQVKWLPGIAAESRSFDANGQYVRTLANGANYAYPLGDRRFFLSAAPILGVQPPKAAAPPPLRAGVPCETQEPPDLRSLVQAPPEPIVVDQNSPAVRAGRERALDEAVRALRREIARRDLPFRVSKEWAPLSGGRSEAGR